MIFTSDHGELLGDHGLYLKGPMMYDALLRVNTMMRGPGIPQGKIITDPVSTLDLASTFCEWGKTTSDAESQSTSLVPLLEGKQAAADFAYNEWNLSPARVGVELQLRTVRTESARLTVDLISNDGELYDLATDPDEMQNLWNIDSASSLQSAMMERINARPGNELATLPAHTE